MFCLEQALQMTEPASVNLRAALALIEARPIPAPAEDPTQRVAAARAAVVRIIKDELPPTW